MKEISDKNKYSLESNYNSEIICRSRCSIIMYKIIYLAFASLPQPFVCLYTLRLGSMMPVFLATPVGVSEAPDDLRISLVCPLVLLEPEGVRVLEKASHSYLTAPFCS